MAVVRYEVEWDGTSPASPERGPNATRLDARLRLVEPTIEEVRTHATALAAYYNEPVNRALMTNDIEFSPGDVVEQFEELWDAGDRPFLLYRDDAMVGDSDLRDVEDDRAEYAILVGPRDTQAKGLGTRFSVMVLALAFGPLGLERVYASVRPENKGSLRMFEKIGYLVDTSEDARQYAEAKDDVCLSIRAADFLAGHAAARAEIVVKPR